MRAAVEALAVPGHQGPQLVDHPALAALRRLLTGPLRFLGRHRRGVAEADRLVDALVQQQVDVVEEEAGALVVRHRPHRPALEQVRGLRQQPRVAKHAAAGDDAGHTRGAEAFDDLLGLDEIAAADHGNRQVAGDAVDQRPVGDAGVGLLRGAAVHGDRRRAGVRHQPRHERRVDLVLGPAGAHLHRHRDLHRPRHRADDRGRVRRIAHQAAAGVVLGDLGHRAAHVDVDGARAHALDDRRGVGHLGGIAAEDLDRDRTFFLGVFRVFEGPVDAPDQALGADHLAHDEAAAAVPLDQPAEGGVGHPGHRRDAEGGLDGEGADLHRELSSSWRAARPGAPGRPRRPSSDRRSSTR